MNERNACPVNLFRWILWIALAVSAMPVSAQAPQGQIEIIQRKDEFLRTLDSLPFTATGTGPVLYIIGYSESKNFQAFESGFGKKLTGLEARRILYGVSPTTTNDAAHLAQTRSIEDFYAILNRAKVIPDLKSDPAAIKALNSVMVPLKNTILKIMTENGWPYSAIVSPQIIWQRSGRVFVRGIGTAQAAQEILDNARQGIDTQGGESANNSSANPSQNIAKIDPIQSDTSGNSTPSATKPAEAAQSAAITDIVGLRLGMSREDVRSAMQAHDKNMKITEQQAALEGLPHSITHNSPHHLTHAGSGPRLRSP